MRPISWLRVLVHGRRNVAAAALDNELDLELALGIERCDVQIRVVHLNSRRRLDVCSGDHTGTLLAEVHDHRLVDVRTGDDETLEVQDHLGDVFGDAVDGAELVENPIHADAGDRCTRDG